MNCRYCGEKLTLKFIDLGSAPLSNAYLCQEDLNKPELYYPLKLFVCQNCWLAQTEDFARPDELFRSDYAYFSSTSTSWLKHAADYSTMVCDRLRVDKESFVIEIASNDGYLLKNFVNRNINCLGIEPTDSTAEAAEQIGIPVMREFFCASLAKQLSREGKQADLIIGNNVYAHVPDINDFTLGLRILLKPGGTITLEFPHLMRLIEYAQFDTIYHEHYSYLSLFTVNKILSRAGLRIYDVEKLSTHGGSLRLYVCHSEDKRSQQTSVSSTLAEEECLGLQSPSTYRSFQQCADQIKDTFLSFLIDQKCIGKKVAAYGAAAKGNTLLNYAGVKCDLLPYVVDRNPAKQNKFLPGSHIPIRPEKYLSLDRPDIVLILPWNIKKEIMPQLTYIREWGGRLGTAMPGLEIV